MLSTTKSPANDRVVYSSSLDGIRVWHVPDVEEVKMDDHFNRLPVWDEHNGEPIWAIKHHPQLPVLISAAADDSIGVWQCPRLEEMESGATGLLQH